MTIVTNGVPMSRPQRVVAMGLRTMAWRRVCVRGAASGGLLLLLLLLLMLCLLHALADVRVEMGQQPLQLLLQQEEQKERDWNGHWQARATDEDGDGDGDGDMALPAVPPPPSPPCAPDLESKRSQQEEEEDGEEEEEHRVGESFTLRGKRAERVASQVRTMIPSTVPHATPTGAPSLYPSTVPHTTQYGAPSVRPRMAPQASVTNDKKPLGVVPVRTSPVRTSERRGPRAAVADGRVRCGPLVQKGNEKQEKSMPAHGGILPACPPLMCGNMSLTHLLSTVAHHLPGPEWLSAMRCTAVAQDIGPCMCDYPAITLQSLRTFFASGEHGLLLIGDSTQRYVYHGLRGLTIFDQLTPENEANLVSGSWTAFHKARNEVYSASFNKAKKKADSPWVAYGEIDTSTKNVRAPSGCQLAQAQNATLIVVNAGLHHLYLPPVRKPVAHHIWPYYRQMVQALLREAISLASPCIERAYFAWRETNAVCDRINLRPQNTYRPSLAAMHHLRAQLGVSHSTRTLTPPMLEQLKSAARQPGVLGVTATAVLNCVPVMQVGCLLSSFDIFGVKGLNIQARRVRDAFREQLLRGTFAPKPMNITGAPPVGGFISYIAEWQKRPLATTPEAQKRIEAHFLGPVAVTESSIFLCDHEGNDARHYSGLEYAQMRAYLPALTYFDKANEAATR